MLEEEHPTKKVKNFWNFSRRLRLRSTHWKMNSKKSKLKIFIKTRDPRTGVNFTLWSILLSPFGSQEKIKSWKSSLKLLKMMFIFLFPAKNMPIMEPPRTDLTEFSQIQISPGNISILSRLRDQLIIGDFRFFLFNFESVYLYGFIVLINDLKFSSRLWVLQWDWMEFISAIFFSIYTIHCNAKHEWWLC